MDRPAVFFEATASVTAQLGELCNFVWSGAVGMWHLRGEVLAFCNQKQGSVQSNGEMDKALHDRFVVATGVRSADLRTTCLNWSWEDVQVHIAKILLFDLCALFEGWLEDVVPRVVPHGTKDSVCRKMIGNLQFPTKVDGNGHVTGFKEELRKITANKSQLLIDVFSSLLRANRKNTWNSIDKLLTAYRYFKECRNSLIHAGGTARKKETDAYNDAAALNYVDIGLAGPMKLPQVTLKSKIKLALPDVVALSSIIHRMTITLDAAFAVTEGAERDMIERMRGIDRKNMTISPSDVKKRHAAIRYLLRKAGLPGLKTVDQLDPLLVSKGLI